MFSQAPVTKLMNAELGFHSLDFSLSKQEHCSYDKMFFFYLIQISVNILHFFSHFVLFTLVINKKKQIYEFYFRHKNIVQKIVCNYLVATGCLSQWLGVSKHYLCAS